MVAFCTVVYSEEALKDHLQKSTVESTKYFDINRISCSIRNDGIFARHPITGNSDFRFDDNPLIYTSGLWIASTVNGEIRASAADFLTDWVGGAIDDQGNPYGKEDSTFRVYKISLGDNATNNPDYASWPFELGAPSDGQGNPLLIGDQTLWCSFTDAYVENREINICPSIGAEVHLTAWGWKDIDNIMFLRWKIFNKSKQPWDDVYLGIFIDPDMGDPRDEFTGCDSTLSLVFDYESSADEFIKNNHAVGYVMLESPIIPSTGDTAFTFYGKKLDYKNVPVMVPKIRKSTSDGWRSPPYLQERTAQIIYNRLQCLDYDGNPAIDPISGLPSKWTYSGDPISGTGWLDERAMDRYMMISVGPFDMAPGDTNSVMTAIIPIRRHNRLTCVYDLKQEAKALQSMFRKSAGFFTEKVYAQVGETGVKFPIKLINSSLVQKIKFDVEFLSDEIEYVEVLPSGRAHDFSVITDLDTTRNIVHVIMEATKNFISVGNKTIANIIVDIKPCLTSSTANIEIRDIKITDEFNNEFKLEKVDGTINIEQFPAPPRLLTPIDSYVADGIGVHFSWTHTEGSHPNIYVLDFNEPFYSKAATDTSLTLAMREFVLRGEYPPYVTWTAKIANYETPISSPDTFKFELPSAEKLNFVNHLYAIHIPEEPGFWQSIVDYYFQPPFLYVFVNYKDTNTNQSFFRLFVFEIFEDLAAIINTQEIDYDFTDGYFRIRDNEAYIYANYSLKTYQVSDNETFTHQKSFSMNFSAHGMQLYKDYLIFSSTSKIFIYCVNSLTDIKKVTEHNISDWPVPDPGNAHHRYDNMMVIKDDYLVLAQGDWGIFDISIPDSFKLIKRVETPGRATTIDYENGFVVVGSADNWLGIYDVSSKDNPILLHAEHYNDLGIGKTYNKIDMLKITGGIIYFENWGLVGLQACHYEPGTYFILDGILSIYDPLITNTKIFSKRGNEINIYQNKLSTSVTSKFSHHSLTYYLFQNYPNPFNNATQINFYLKQSAKVKLIIYNIRGQLVATLLDKFKQAGLHAIFWDALDNSHQPVSSGLYFYQLKVDEKIITKKMLLLK